MTMLREAISKITCGEDLTTEESTLVMEEIISGRASPSLVTALLAALRTKGETVEEIVGFAKVMRRHSVRVSPSRDDLVDTCGTGGDGRNTFNISTTAAFVIAGAGVGVAKHGNRAVSSACGSADLLESLGIEIGLAEGDVERCIDEVGIGFLFAQKLHPAMKHAAGPRKELGIKTVFNVLGPLTNPAGVKRQLVGVFAPGLARKIAVVLAELGAERALVVHSEDGLDEISISGRTTGYYFDGEKIMRILIDPGDYGIEPSPPGALEVSGVDESREAFLSVISGENGPRRDVVLLNAGAALFVAGRARSISEGVELAAESIDEGRAREKYEALAELSRRLAGENR